MSVENKFNQMKALLYTYRNISSFRKMLFMAFLGVMFVAACKTQSSENKIRSIGAPGELLIVIDPSFEGSVVKQRVIDFATQEFPCIPQPEPTFRITTIAPKDFEGHFKSYRNILILKQSIIQKAQVKYKRNIWARGQQVVEVDFQGAENFANMFDENQNQIFNHLYYGDINTLANANKKGADAATARYIKKKYNLDIVIPQGYRLVKDTLGFSWFRYDKLETIQSVIFHEFNLDSIPSLNTSDLVALRNKVSRRYVPGPNSKSYMTTEDRLPVVTQRIMNQNMDIIEMRGLWKVDGYFMGGPFVNYFIKDEVNHKLLMIEGFVYAPKKQNKAYYVRQVESILHSLKFS